MHQNTSGKKVKMLLPVAVEVINVMLNEGLQHLEKHQILLCFSVLALILAGLSLQSYHFPIF